MAVGFDVAKTFSILLKCTTRSISSSMRLVDSSMLWRRTSQSLWSCACCFKDASAKRTVPKGFLSSWVSMSIRALRSSSSACWARDCRACSRSDSTSCASFFFWALCSSIVIQKKTTPMATPFSRKSSTCLTGPTPGSKEASVKLSHTPTNTNVMYNTLPKVRICRC